MDGIQFQLNSKLFSDPPTFTLRCLTSGFSTESLWKKDSVTIANSTDYLIIDKVINEARFEILHSLTVTGRHGGLYQFSIRRQNGSSEVSRELLVQGLLICNYDSRKTILANLVVLCTCKLNFYCKSSETVFLQLLKHQGTS